MPSPDRRQAVMDLVIDHSTRPTTAKQVIVDNQHVVTIAHNGRATQVVLPRSASTTRRLASSICCTQTSRAAAASPARIAS